MVHPNVLSHSSAFLLGWTPASRPGKINNFYAGYAGLTPTDRYAALGGGWTGELSFGFLNALDLLGEDFMGRRVHP